MDNLAKDKTSKLLVKYSIPAIIAMLVTCLYNTADRAFIGSMEGVGAYAISGLGVTMPLFTLIGAFGVAVSVGGSTNISIKLGAKEKEEAEKLLGNTFALELLGGFVIMVLGLVFIDQILYAFGASAKTLPYAKDYMSVIIIRSCSKSIWIQFKWSDKSRWKTKTSSNDYDSLFFTKLSI